MAQINEAVLDAVVREVMPDVIWAMKMGSTRNYSFALRAYHPIVVMRYRQEIAALREDQS